MAGAAFVTPLLAPRGGPRRRRGRGENGGPFAVVSAPRLRGRARGGEVVRADAASPGRAAAACVAEAAAEKEEEEEEEAARGPVVRLRRALAEACGVDEEVVRACGVELRLLEEREEAQPRRQMLTTSSPRPPLLTLGRKQGRILSRSRSMSSLEMTYHVPYCLSPSGMVCSYAKTVCASSARAIGVMVALFEEVLGRLWILRTRLVRQRDHALQALGLGRLERVHQQRLAHAGPVRGRHDDVHVHPPPFRSPAYRPAAGDSRRRGQPC